MSQPNQPEQNYEIQSPTLETQVRTLLPSVAGYGGLLRSTNTIVPIIDLTEAAGGSDIGQNLQTALAFGSQTAFNVTSGTTTIANVPGFYRVTGIANTGTGSTSQQSEFVLTDGVSNKVIFEYSQTGKTPFDFVVFLAAGESLNVTASNNNFSMNGSIRQIATVDGTLVMPSGFVT